jgi:phosphatidylglycerol:prolipoprotein diacylglycerol transferase
MIDEHLIPYASWGVKPVLFHIGSFPVPSYSFFVFLAFIAGILVYWLEARKNKQANENTFYIALGAIIGGVIGAKLFVMLAYWQTLVSNFNWDIILTGKSIVGGLIGGTIGVLITKKILHISNQRRGNLFAPAIALGVAIGRIGCFLKGCCYGKPTNLPWGVDFGDGILRQPTQVYESIFMLIMFFYLWNRNKKNPAPGSSFSILMVSYFIFRFFIEFIREEPVLFLGLTFFQYICIGVLAWYAVGYFRRKNL